MRQLPKGLIVWIACVLLSTGCSTKESANIPTPTTFWSLQPSLKYDTCHLIGILAGRPLYLKLYPEIHHEWGSKLPAPVKTAILQIDKIIGPEWPPGPRLSLLLSFVPADDSLGAILQAMDRNKEIYDRLMQSDYASQNNWRQWIDVKPHLQTVLRHLQSSGFENYWREQLWPAINARIVQARQELQSYDVVGDLKRFFVDFDTRDTLQVFLLALSHPHEIRLSSYQRATDISNPLKETVRSFYEQLAHPYCDRLVDSLFAADFTALQSDSFLVSAQRRYAGGRSMPDYLRKELVIAVELWLAGRRQLLPVATDGEEAGNITAVRQYLQTRDSGAHVLAAVIYSYLESGLKVDRLTYADFIRDLFASGRLRAGKIAPRYMEFMTRPARSEAGSPND
ncbi:MAG: hypothetical protein ONB48_10520 [candidate division KSB1 bacterium]|nr:hypothetical protein [candidate division KSB1 bacterium]MDZ7273922.1 hypothetical protein [candidate division KSB1 bacterium]MDZ7286078.1 hypothetical protein [candidate division KSB1 bacterium]MDZ7299110.1 hypothetical protein [candidate division KSB1 bacterium]MDZ7306657.1 hypothetical protein [candidate division KSB1 bacterium]